MVRRPELDCSSPGGTNGVLLTEGGVKGILVWCLIGANGTSLGLAVFKLSIVIVLDCDSHSARESEEKVNSILWSSFSGEEMEDED